MSDYDDWENYDFRVRRYPDITLRTTDVKTAADYLRAFRAGAKVTVNVHGWHGEAFVSGVFIANPVDGIRDVRVTLKPTGAPITFQDQSATHANIVEEIALRLWKALSSDLPATQRWRIARTEATKAFNAAKTAAMRSSSYVTKDEARDYMLSVDCAEGEPQTFDAQAEANVLHTELAKQFDARLHTELAKRFIDGASKATGVPVGVLTAAPKDKTMNKNTVKVKPKRFYVGHTDTILERNGRQGWAKDTLAEAIAHATTRAEQTGEPQYVVKVIKVVRKKPQPIVVEDVK